MLPAVFKLYARQLTAPGRWVATEAIAQAFGISLPSLDMGKLNLPVQKAPCSVTVIDAHDTSCYPRGGKPLKIGYHLDGARPGCMSDSNQPRGICPRIRLHSTHWHDHIASWLPILDTHNRSTTPRRGEMTPTTLLLNSSGPPPYVAIRSLSASSTSTPRSFSILIDAMASASSLEISPPLSSAAYEGMSLNACRP